MAHHPRRPSVTLAVWIALPWLPAHVSLFVLLFPANALRVNRSLQTLCVGDAAFGDESCAALCDGLLENEGACVLAAATCMRCCCDRAAVTMSPGLVALDLEHKGLTSGAAASIGRGTATARVMSTAMQYLWPLVPSLRTL
jgi:hypothetical protein